MNGAEDAKHADFMNEKAADGNQTINATQA